MNPYHFRISLRLKHPTRDLSFAGLQFGLTPQREWVSGVPRATPAGSPLEGTNKSSYWTGRMLEMTHSLDDTLDEAIDAAMEKLRLHATFFQQFRDDGGTVNFLIGIFGPKNFGLVFPPALLGE